MKLIKRTIRGIGIIGDAEFDASTLTGDLVAVVGENGAGKSTFVECGPGALYGEVPSHGLLLGMATATDSMVEEVIETDQVYTLRRVMDGARRKQEAYIFDAAGKPLNDGKVTTFKAEVERRFPSLRMYLASGFAAQKRNGQFLEAPKADRRALFAEMLGLGYLQALSKTAGEKAAEAERLAAELRSKAEVLRGRAGEAERAPFARAAASVAAACAAAAREEAERAADSAAVALDAWRTEAGRLDIEAERASGRLREALTTRDRAKEDVDSAQRRLPQLAAERAGLSARLEKRAAMEAAVARGAGAQGRLASIDQELAELRAAHNAAADARASAIDQRDSWRSRRQSLQRRLDLARHNVESATKAAAGLGDVPCGGEGDFAGCSLISSATRARSSLPELGSEAQRAAKALEDHGTEPGVPPAPDRERIQALEIQRREAEASARDLASAEKALAELGAVAERAERLDGEIEEVRGVLEGARRKLGEAIAVVTEAQDAHQASRGARQAHEAKRPEVPSPERLASLRRAETSAAQDVARAEEVLAGVREAVDALDALTVEIESATARVDDWREAQRALGPDGVQALEVDAAGPEVSDLINELLHSCYGSRFTCRLETTALKADGSGTKEIFDLLVIDSQNGTEGSASDLSGGERVLVAEAVSLAIAIYNARRSRIPILDLWRDECAGALDYKRAPLYVEMLRKAARIGGFHRVYFIAHQRELWDLADSKIFVRDGHVSIGDAQDEAPEGQETEAAA